MMYSDKDSFSNRELFEALDRASMDGRDVKLQTQQSPYDFSTKEFTVRPFESRDTVLRRYNNTFNKSSQTFFPDFNN